MIGMIVDTVSQVVRVPESSIAPPPPMTTGGVNEYIDGVARLEDRLVILMKVDAMLTTEEVVQLKQVEEEQPKETVENTELEFEQKSFEQIKEELAGEPIGVS